MERNANLDAARVLGCLAVVMLHTSARTIYRFDEIGAASWLSADLLNSATRWGVPVFVMISGALLLRLPIDDWGAFYLRRARRIIAALIAWPALYYLWRSLFHHEEGLNAAFVNDLFHGQPYFHLYFLYLITGLYVFTPPLAVAVDCLSETTLFRTVAIALAFAFVSFSLESYLEAVGPTALTYFVPYVGYFLAGGYIVRHSKKRWAFHATLFLISTITAFGLTAASAFIKGINWPWTLYFYSYFSPTVIVMSLSAFVLLRHARLPVGIARMASGFAPLTFGIYLVHPIFLELLRNQYQHHAPAALWPIVDVPLTFALTILLSAAVVRALQRVPLVRAAV